MSTRFACPACQAAICTPRPLPAGTAVRCPKCKQVFPCPGQTAAIPVAAAITATPPRPAPVVPAKLVDTICPRCGILGWVDEKRIGQTVKCEGCGAAYGAASPAVSSRSAGRRRMPLPLMVGSATFAVLMLVSAVSVFALHRAINAPASSPLASAPIAATPRVASPSQPIPATPAVQMLPGYDDWLQDLEAAKAKAAREKKDILILFDGSDWCGWSIRLANAVLFQSEFKYQASQKFVLVFIDFPRYQAALDKVQNAARNERLSERFAITGYPTFVLTDAQGLPYATDGYAAVGPQEYLARLAVHQQSRIHRDQLFAAVQQAQGSIPKLIAAKKAHDDYLQSNPFLPHYQGQIQAWYQLARQHDAKNDQGFVEYFFEADWLLRMEELNFNQPNQLVQWASQLDDWKKTYPFREAHRGARLHLAAATVLTDANRTDLARRHLTAAATYAPNDPEIKRRLAAAK